MLFIKKCMSLLLPMGILIGGLVACSEDTVSLEEALLLRESEYTEPEKEKEGFWEQLGIMQEDVSEESGQVQEQFKTGEPTLEEPEQVPQIYVYICGAVQEPGVYVLPEGSRIISALEAAGGFLEEAAEEAINLAEPITDGMQITIPTKEEERVRKESAARESCGLVNLNTADITELCTLNGIGESKARAILAYRQEIGGFHSVEQLKEVSGIGDSLFTQIKDSIYIE